MIRPSGQAYELKGHWWNVTSLAFSADGKYLVSGGADATVRFWDLSKISSDTTIVDMGEVVGNHPTRVASVAISDDRTKIFSKNENGTLIMWTIKTN